MTWRCNVAGGDWNNPTAFHIYNMRGNNGDPAGTRMWGMKPAVYTCPGQPNFRTTKELGNRAIVADSFSKCSYTDGLGRWLPSSGGPPPTAFSLHSGWHW